MDLRYWIALVAGCYLAARVALALARRRPARRPEGLLLVLAPLVAIGIAVAVVHDRFGVGFGELALGGALGSLVIGMVIQSVISGLLAGVGVSMRAAFRVGDHVRVGDHEGIVTATGWRTTTLLTPAQSHLTLPNRIVADSPIVNFDRPSRRRRAVLRVPVSAAARPNVAARVLEECAAMIPSILADPKPRAQHLGFENGVAVYGVTVVVGDADADAEADAADRLRRLAWYRLRRAGIEAMYAGAPSTDPAAREHVAELLARVPVFAKLGPDAVARLAEKAKVELYGAGEQVFRRGDEGEALYVVRSGAVEVSAAGETHARGPGDALGEESLTGAPRSADATAATDTELVVIERAGLEEVALGDRAAAEGLVAAVRERVKEGATGARDDGRSLLARVERFLSQG